MPKTPKETSANCVTALACRGYIGGYGTQNGCMNEQNISDIKKSIETYAALGCEVQVTEMAVRNYMNTKAIQKKTCGIL